MKRFTCQYVLLLLLGLCGSVATVFAKDIAVSYETYHGSTDKPFAEKTSAYFEINYDSIWCGLPKLEREDLTVYAVSSAHHPDQSYNEASAIRFNYTPTKENPYLCIYFAIEKTHGTGGHTPAYDYIYLYTPDSQLLDCSFFFQSDEEPSPGFIPTGKYLEQQQSYRPWEALIFDLTDYVGQSIRIDGVAAGCTTSRCRSKLYMAFDSFKLTDLCTNCDSICMRAPSLALGYTWHKGSYSGPIVGTDSVLCVPNADIDDYYCTFKTISCDSISLLMGRGLDVFPQFSYRVGCGEQDTIFITNSSQMHYHSTEFVVPCDTSIWMLDGEIFSTAYNPQPIVVDGGKIVELSLHTGKLDLICDTQVVQNIALGQVVYTDTIDTICNNMLPYSWRERLLWRGGVYQDTLTNRWGCDSIRQLSLEVLSISQDTFYYEVQEGKYILWKDERFDKDTIVYRTYTNSVGCDSIITMILTVIKPTESHTYLTICPDHFPYEWNNQTFWMAGDYKVTLVSAAGGDSIAHLHLKEGNPARSAEAISVCLTDLPYDWHGKLLSKSGVYIDTLASMISGCDSITTLKLTIKDCTKPQADSIPLNPQRYLPFTDSIDTIICIGDTIDWHSMRLYSDTLVRDTGYYWFGVDSVYWVMKVTTKDCSVCDTAYSTTYKQLKASDLPYTWNSQTVPAIPLHPNQDTTLVAPLMKSDLSCDSIATLHLHILFPCELPAVYLPTRMK